MQLLCTLRNHCRQWPRNTRYQADATPYLGRTFTGWIAPALPGALIRSPSSVSASNVGETPRQWGELPVAIWLPVLRQVEQKALVERSAFRRAVRVHARPLKAMESPGCPIANSPIILLLCCYRAGAFPQRLGDGNVVSSLIAWMRVTTRLRSFRSLEAPVPSGFCGPRL